MRGGGGVADSRRRPERVECGVGLGELLEVAQLASVLGGADRCGVRLLTQVVPQARRVEEALQDAVHEARVACRRAGARGRVRNVVGRARRCDRHAAHRNSRGRQSGCPRRRRTPPPPRARSARMDAMPAPPSRVASPPAAAVAASRAQRCKPGSVRRLDGCRLPCGASSLCAGTLCCNLREHARVRAGEGSRPRGPVRVGAARTVYALALGAARHALALAASACVVGRLVARAHGPPGHVRRDGALTSAKFAIIMNGPTVPRHGRRLGRRSRLRIASGSAP